MKIRDDLKDKIWKVKECDSESDINSLLPWICKKKKKIIETELFYFALETVFCRQLWDAILEPGSKTK